MKHCKKRRFGSDLEAQAHLNRLGPKLGDFTMAPYFCRRCGCHHVGHKSRDVKKTQLTIRAAEDRIRSLRFASTSQAIKERSDLIDFVRRARGNPQNA